MRASIGAAVDISRYIDENHRMFSVWTPDDQAQAVAEYVRNGAPSW